jgi:hypothetical protein
MTSKAWTYDAAAAPMAALALGARLSALAARRPADPAAARRSAAAMNTARLRELASYLGVPGPWRARRSDVDGSLVLYASDEPDAEPLALIYGGTDLAHYLEQCAPAVLLAEQP